ncbi:MAG: PHP domain-containing protein [Clostridia bacterium]|nr:PHP domain-containing protein [Clostridia bacterium]
MKKYYYDLHMHSCLSPCGDDDMTPNNIAGMGVVAKLDIMALTDHNTCRNCPAFFKTAEANGIIPVAGMELTTAEDIHLVCLFEKIEDAMKFDEAVNKQRIPFKNRVDIFGEQMVMNENDEVIGIEENLLSNATMITVDDAPKLVEEHGGICYPAHIDREANGIVATLGIFPDMPYFPCYELHDGDKKDEYLGRFPILSDKPCVVSSDAHYLWDINGRLNCFELEVEEETPENIRKKLFERLKGI